MVELPESAKTQSPKSFLLTSIAKTHLGSIAGVIISGLISHGKLTAGEISSKCKLPIKTVKSTLVSLIQLNCVFYWLNGGATHYSFNERGLLVFLHSGDIIDYIQRLYDSESAEIIQNVIQVGHVRVQDYTKGKVELDEKFVKLYDDGWLMRLQPFHYSPMDDLWQKLYQETLKETPRLATVSEIKRTNEAKERTKVKLSNILDSGVSKNDVYEFVGGFKTLKPSLVVTFNLLRFEKHLRSRSFVNFSKSRIGTLSSKVYEAALATVEKNSPELSPILLSISGLINDPEEARLLVNLIENKLVDQRLITFQAKDIVKHLDSRVDLQNSILTHNFLKPAAKRVVVEQAGMNKRIKTEDGESIEISETITTNDDTAHAVDAFQDFGSTDAITLINHHLKLLAASSTTLFLIETSPGTFTVPFKALSDELKQFNFDNIIKTTLGFDAFKILRCLRSLKLADEKTLANTILLKEKTVRNEIFKLININAVEIQEVPRSADRAASKTFFLFRHKPYVSYNFVKNAIIYNMGEVLSNIENFKYDHKILLEKCEREDVKGNEDQLLLDSELKTLRDLQSREVNNIGKFNRLKSLYDIFGLI